MQSPTLRIIYPEYEHYSEQLETANLGTLCDELDAIYVWAKPPKYDTHQTIHYTGAYRNDQPISGTLNVLVTPMYTQLQE